MQYWKLLWNTLVFIPLVLILRWVTELQLVSYKPIWSHLVGYFIEEHYAKVHASSVFIYMLR